MIASLFATIDLAACGELALLLFFAVFVAVIVRTLRSDRREMQQHAQRAIHDRPEIKE